MLFCSFCTVHLKIYWRISVFLKICLEVFVRFNNCLFHISVPRFYQLEVTNIYTLSTYRARDWIYCVFFTSFLSIVIIWELSNLNISAASYATSFFYSSLLFLSYLTIFIMPANTEYPSQLDNSEPQYVSNSEENSPFPIDHLPASPSPPSIMRLQETLPYVKKQLPHVCLYDYRDSLLSRIMTLENNTSDNCNDILHNFTKTFG